MQQLFYPRARFVLIFFAFILATNFVCAAHYVVGLVNDAYDGTSADDLNVVLWNSVNGIDDNLTDIIGANGNSGYSNFYLIDCEMLNTPCGIGDVLNITVLDSPFSENITVTITGAGFDLAQNITLNSVLSFLSIVVDDSYQFPIFPENEIDLLAATTQEVFCEAIVEDFDGIDIQNVSSEFFDESVSFFGDLDDNNSHYTNTSCYVNESYGTSTQAQVICGFSVLYNANSGNWNCTMTMQDNFSLGIINSDATSINQLLAIQLSDSVDFGSLSGGQVSNESLLNVTNMGNVMINLSFYGYGSLEGDGNAMVCGGGNISVDYKKYNLTESNPGSLNLNQFELTYTNLTTSSVTEEFNLNYRQEEDSNEAINSTYWRVYVPSSISGSCTGNIVFGATVGG